MPRDGSGGYLPPQNSWNPAINGAQALPNDWQAILNDLAAAMQASLAADGQTPVTGIMNFQNNRISNVGAPIGAGDVLRWEQMIKGPDIPSAATISVPIEGQLFDVTGTTTITTINDRFPGRMVFLRFTDALTLTSSTGLYLPGGKDITTRSGDIGIFVNHASGAWSCVAYSGAHDVQAASLNGGPLAGLRNRIINGAFQINQRGYASGAATTAGQYTLDRWKVTGTGGITFSTTSGKTTVTIPSGQTLQQVIEGLNLPAGDYVLSWEGTAQGRIDGGSYGASGSVTVTLAGGANSTIEFNAGTLANVQLEPGTIATAYEARPIPLETMFGQRYYESGFIVLETYGTANQSLSSYIKFATVKRVSPSMAVTDNGSAYTTGSFSGISPNSEGCRVKGTKDGSSGAFLMSVRWTAASEL